MFDRVEFVPLGGARGHSFAPVTIVDDDVNRGVFGFTSANYATNENATNIILTVIRTNGSGQPPINLKFNFEGEEEMGSPNLPKFVKEHKERLKADFVIILEINSISLYEKGSFSQLFRGNLNALDNVLRNLCDVADAWAAMLAQQAAAPQGPGAWHGQLA